MRRALAITSLFLLMALPAVASSVHSPELAITAVVAVGEVAIGSALTVTASQTIIASEAGVTITTTALFASSVAGQGAPAPGQSV